MIFSRSETASDASFVSILRFESSSAGDVELICDGPYKAENVEITEPRKFPSITELTGEIIIPSERKVVYITRGPSSCV